MLIVTYAARVGAMPLVLLIALSSAAMASTAVDPTPLLDYVITAAFTVLSGLGAWALAYLERRSALLRRTQALDIVRRVMNDSLQLGEHRVRELAKGVRLNVGNERVAAIVNNIQQQAPEEVRRLGYSEEYLAQWALSQLGMAPEPKQAPEGYHGTQGLT